MSMDEQYMLQAIELAKQGEGLTRPNPPVGAVLVQDGEVIAEGWHEKAGGLHAERACMEAWRRAQGAEGRAQDAGSLKSATLYVTLEPCSTHGMTPPCTDLILENGIGRVAVSVEDRNPAHAGRGLELLRAAGVEVISGICEKEGRELVAPFEKFITTGMPYVTLKLASTLDGRIADSRGDSKWITGPEARERVQSMRRRADAVMAGAATIRADDPSLLPRPAEGRAPWRVVIGKDIPHAAKVLTDAAKKRTLVFNVEPGSLRDVLKVLAEQHDIMHVLCEGGGKLAAGLVEERLVDEFAFFIAPKLMGSDGIPNFARNGGLMADLTQLEFRAVERLGDDVLLRARPVLISE